MDRSLKGQVRVAGESRTDVAPRRRLEMFKQFVLAHRAEVVCACLLLLMAINLFAAISRKSITNDEIVHIPAGYYHLVAGDFHLNNEHPPLIKMWAVLPLLFIQPEEPSALDARHEGLYGAHVGIPPAFLAGQSRPVRLHHFLDAGDDGPTDSHARCSDLHLLAKTLR